MSIAGGIASVKTGFELVKGAVDLLKRPEVDAHEISARLLELQGLMLDAQKALGDAEEENRQLRQELVASRATQRIDESLVFASHVYWKRQADEKLDGPYCTTCWDDARKLVRLKYDAEGVFGGYESVGRSRRYDCVIHKTMFLLPVAIFKDTTIS